MLTPWFTWPDESDTFHFMEPPLDYWSNLMAASAPISEAILPAHYGIPEDFQSFLDYLHADLGPEAPEVNGGPQHSDWLVP